MSFSLNHVFELKYTHLEKLLKLIYLIQHFRLIKNKLLLSNSILSEFSHSTQKMNEFEFELNLIQIIIHFLSSVCMTKGIVIFLLINNILKRQKILVSLFIGLKLYFYYCITNAILIF